MKMKYVVLVLLAVSLLVTLGPLAIAQAKPIKPPPDPKPPGQGADNVRNKGVLTGLPPGPSSPTLL